MRHRFLVLIILLLTIGCDKVDKTESDSISTVEITRKSIPFLNQSQLDSALLATSNNVEKAYILLNERNYEEAIKYFKQASDKVELTPWHLTTFGMCYEEIGMIDSAKIYYNNALDKYKTDSAYMVFGPHLHTVLEDKKSGMKLLNQEKDSLSEWHYFRTKNDIQNYSGTGLTEFFEFMREDNKTDSFSIDLNHKSLKEAEQFEAIKYVETEIARQGINVTGYAANNNGVVKIMTTRKYSNQLENIDSVKIERL